MCFKFIASNERKNEEKKISLGILIPYELKLRSGLISKKFYLYIFNATKVMSNKNSILGKKSWHSRGIIYYDGTVFHQIHTIMQ